MTSAVNVSRVFVRLMSVSYTHLDVYKRQQQDPVLKPIIEQLTQGIKSEKYVLSKNVLCLKIRDGKELRIIASDVIKPMLMEYFHSSTCLLYTSRCV